MLIRGFVYLSCDSIDNNLVKISLSLKKTVSKMLLASKIIHRIVMCKYPHRAFTKLKSQLTSDFEVSYKGSDYFIGDINAMLIIFDETIKKMFMRQQGVWYGKNILPLEFQSYACDKSYYGDKMLFKILWKTGKIKYIERNTIKHIMVCDIEYRESIQYLDKLRANNIIKSNCEYDFNDKKFVTTLDTHKATVILHSSNAKIKNMIECFNDAHSINHTNTMDCINNMLLKNAILKIYNTEKYMYCTIQLGTTGIDTLVIDTTGIWSRGVYYEKIVLYVQKIGNTYYTCENNQCMDIISKLIEDKLIID